MGGGEENFWNFSLLDIYLSGDRQVLSLGYFSFDGMESCALGLSRLVDIDEEEGIKYINYSIDVLYLTYLIYCVRHISKMFNKENDDE